VKLIWSRDAGRDRDHIFDYIAPQNFPAAVSIDEKIVAIEEQLTRFPLSGRTGRFPGTRELVIQNTPYIAVYSADHATVRILRLIHSAQQWPEDDA
jgi:addiction module RelE/StbE family toxin